jgi:4-hydroxy-tetrahydrodipicolinate synthase
MTLHPLSGVYAAALTPLRSDYSLDLDSVPVYLDFLAKRGCHGALLLGTTGEGPSFSPDERVELFRAALRVRESHPGFRLLAGTGTPSLAETADLNRAAFDLGFDGVVCLPPFYYRKATDEGLLTWFEAVITRSVPADQFLLGYHFPAVAGIGFSVPLLTRLKDAFPVQFAGIKDSSHDAELAHNLGDLFGEELLVLTGTDSYLQLAMDNRAGGCITAPANLISPSLRAVYDASRQGGDPSKAQKVVTEQRHILEKYPPFPSALKALVSRLHGLPRWAVRPPLDTMSDDALESALAELTQAGYA